MRLYDIKIESYIASSFALPDELAQLNKHVESSPQELPHLIALGAHDKISDLQELIY